MTIVIVATVRTLCVRVMVFVIKDLTLGGNVIYAVVLTATISKIAINYIFIYNPQIKLYPQFRSKYRILKFATRVFF